MEKISFSVRSEVLCVFAVGCCAGFVTSLLLPVVGRSYFSLYRSDVASFALQLHSRLGVAGLVSAVFLKNMIPVSLLTFLPYILIVYYLRSEWRARSGGLEFLKVSLKMLSFLPILAYGFAVYGLFLGHLFVGFSTSYTWRILLSLVSHGWLEVLIMLSAGSTGLNFAKVAEAGRHDLQKEVDFKAVFNGWGWLASGTMMAALIEVLLYPLLV